MPLIMDEEEITSFKETNNTRTYSFSEPDSMNMILDIYGIIFVTEIFNNISTCILIERSCSMHTATKFYLCTIVICALLFFTCGMPLEVHRLWNPFSYPLGEKLCITMELISEMSVYTTMITITAFTIERYIDICRPLTSHTLSKLSRIVRYIIAIDICALYFVVLQMIQFGIVTYKTNGDRLHHFFAISSCAFFLVPMSLITVLYVLIGIKLDTSRLSHPLKKSSVASGGRPNSTPRFRRGVSGRRVIRMLVPVTVLFFLCWTPFYVHRLITIYGKYLEHPTDNFYKFYVILNTLWRVVLPLHFNRPLRVQRHVEQIKKRIRVSQPK